MHQLQSSGTQPLAHRQILAHRTISSVLWASSQAWKFGGRGVVIWLTATPMLPNFQPCGEHCRPDNMALCARSCQCVQCSVAGSGKQSWACMHHDLFAQGWTSSGQILSTAKRYDPACRVRSLCHQIWHKGTCWHAASFRARNWAGVLPDLACGAGLACWITFAY